MNLNWSKYFYDLGSAVLRNVGMVLVAAGSVNGAHASGLDVPLMNLKAIGIFLLVAGVFPAVGAFWQKSPLPEVKEVTVTTVTTIEKTEPSKPEESKL